MTRLVCTVIYCFSLSFLFAQGDPGDVFSLWKAGGKGPVQAKHIDVITDPPDQPARSMAEWEELQAIAVSYDLTGFSEEKKQLISSIIEYAQQEVDVIVFCHGALVFNIISRVRNDLQRRGVSLDRVHFIETDFNSRIWIRDYGPHSVYLNAVDSLVLVDWKYEPQFRAADEEVSNALSSFLEVPLYATTSQPFDLKLDGGNFLTDGNGMAFSSSHVIEDNPIDPATIDFTVQQFMGIDLYPKLQKLNYDVIHHVDMHMKIIDEETILVGQYPEGVADGPRIEENLQWFLDNVKTVFGTDFKVERIIMPPDEYGNYPDSLNNCSAAPGYGCYYTYTNALFVNKMVLVPTYFDETSFDTIALQRWREIMPGYDIVGIDCKEIIREYGAIHCVAKEIGVKKPVRIVHQKKLSGCADAPYQEVWTNAQHATGIEKVRIHFRSNQSEDFQSYEMAEQGDEEYLAYLPNAQFGDTIFYYFEAIANNGKSLVRPFPGSEGPYAMAINCQTSSTMDAFKENAVRVYPNPGSLTRLEVLDQNWLGANWRLENLNGTTLKTGVILSSDESILESGEVPPGFYVLYLEQEAAKAVTKVIIQ